MMGGDGECPTYQPCPIGPEATSSDHPSLRWQELGGCGASSSERAALSQTETHIHTATSRIKHHAREEKESAKVPSATFHDGRKKLAEKPALQPNFPRTPAESPGADRPATTTSLPWLRTVHAPARPAAAAP